VLHLARETLRSYARPLSAISAIFLGSLGLSFALGTDRVTHLAPTPRRDPMMDELVKRALADLQRRSPELFAEKLPEPELFAEKPRGPTWFDGVRRGLHAGVKGSIPLALGAAALAVASIITGCAFGLLPLAVAVLAGAFLGPLAHEAVDHAGVWAVLPVMLVFSPTILLTFPAVLLGSAIGLRLGATVLAPRRIARWKEEMRLGLAAWLRVIVPTLALGAALQIAVLTFLGGVSVS